MYKILIYTLDRRCYMFEFLDKGAAMECLSFFERMGCQAMWVKDDATPFP